MVKGIVRKVDELGRLVIPKEMRKEAGIGLNEPTDIYFDNGIICIEAYRVGCKSCGSTDKELSEVNGIKLCEDCIWEFRDKMAKSAEKTQEYLKALEKRLARKRRIGGAE